jgi:hypothetical protein
MRRSTDARHDGFHMAEVQLRVPRPMGLLVLFLGIPCMVAATAMVVWLVAVELGRGEFNPSLLVLLGAIVHMVILISGVLRDWESLFTTFRLSDRGVLIENRRYDSLFLEWGEIDSASYHKYTKVIRLRSSRLQKPIAIINNLTHKPSMEFQAALKLAKRHMPGGYRERLV